MSLITGSADFVVAYEGLAVDDGRMPVRDLAPALLALADLTQEANAVSSVGAPTVSLDIRAFGKGSFNVDLVLLAAAGILTSDPVTAAANLITLTSGALDLLNLIRRRTVVERLPITPNQTRIRLADGTEILAQPDAISLIERDTFRSNARSFVRPLTQPDMDHIRIIINGRPQLDVSSADVDAFNEPAGSDARLEQASDTTRVLTVASLSFIEGNKWRLTFEGHVDGFVYLGVGTSVPSGSALTVQASAKPSSGDTYFADLLVTEFNHTSQQIVGTIKNPRDHEVQAPFSVDVFCLAPSGALQAEVGAFADVSDKLAAGATSPFTVSLYGTLCQQS